MLASNSLRGGIVLSRSSAGFGGACLFSVLLDEGGVGLVSRQPMMNLWHGSFFLSFFAGGGPNQRNWTLEEETN